MAESRNRAFAKLAKDVTVEGNIKAEGISSDVTLGGATVYATRVAMPMSGNTSGDQAYVTENNRLYIWNGSGWFSVALINTTPTITNAPSSVYNLYANGSPTIITLAATDEDGDTLTWSYSSASASGKATITQADNVFTITPLTDIADTSFTIDFQVTDGINTSTATSTINIDNRAPVIDTGPSATYALATDGSPTVITLAATDPDGGSITWSYAATGLSGQATVVQNVNEFTITPATTPQEYADFTITFTASDSIESTSTAATTFSLTFVLLADAWSDSILSIGTSSTNALDNSTFIDRSTNTHTVTTSGTPVQTAFHPYLDNWSSYISSEAGALCYQDDALRIGTGDFTAEGWFWISADTTTTGTYHALFDTSKSMTYGYTNTTYSTHIGFWLRNDYALRIYSAGSAALATTSNTLNVNEWNHCALVRSGTTVTMYINGVSGGTFSSSANYNLNSVAFGIAPHWTTSYTAGPMYVGNFRLEVGNARYTANFTPPTTAFVNTANTVFLKNYNNHQALIGGVKTNSVHSTDVEASAFNPFGQESEYAVGENKGSGYFDGADDYLTYTSPLIDLSGDLTFETWMYAEDASANFKILDHRNNSVSGTQQNRILFDWNVTGFRLYINGSAVFQTTTSSSVILNNWVHISLVRSSDTFKLYLNGSEIVSQVNSTDVSISNGDLIAVGSNSNDLGANFFPGYFSDYNFTPGNAKYTTNFTPPTAPVGNTNASLYLPMDNTGIYDKTGNETITLVGVTTSTTQTKFADTSYYIASPSTNYIGLDTIPDYGRVPFTLEMWAYPTATNTNMVIFDTRPNSSLGFNWNLNGGTGMSVYAEGSTRLNVSNVITNSSWNHIALVFDGTNATAYANGTAVASAFSIGSSSPWSGAQKTLGAVQYTPRATASGFVGYIEGFQLLIGITKYTANFTPPTQEQGRAYQAES